MAPWIEQAAQSFALHSRSFYIGDSLWRYEKGTSQWNLQQALDNPKNGDFQIKLVYDDNWMKICIKDMSNRYGKRFERFNIFLIDRRVLSIIYSQRSGQAATQQSALGDSLDSVP